MQGKDIKKLVGKNIRLLRKSRDMGQRALMKKLGIRSQPQMSQIENGTYRVGEETLQQIADIFGVPFSYLYSENLGNLIFKSSSAKEDLLLPLQSPKKVKTDKKTSGPYNKVSVFDYLSSKERRFVFAYYPFFYLLNKHYLKKFFSAIEKMPAMDKIIFKLRFLNTPYLKIEKHEFLFLAKKSGISANEIMNNINVFRKTSEQIDTRAILRKLNYELESALFSIYHAKQNKIADEKKVKYFVAKKQHYIKRIRKIIRLNLADYEWISNITGISLRQTKSVMNSGFLAVTKFFEDELI